MKQSDLVKSLEPIVGSSLSQKQLLHIQSHYLRTSVQSCLSLRQLSQIAVPQLDTSPWTDVTSEMQSRLLQHTVVQQVQEYEAS